MTGRDSVNHLPCVLLRLIRHGFFRIGLVLLCLTFSSPTQADTVITETPGAGNVGTQVPPPSGNIYGITGGKTVGSNLFHSFEQFSVATGDIAQFQTLDLTPNASIGNILGRVTGGNPSAIFGTIDSATYYPNADLFLMNPHGFLFGPNATINIGGMAHFTTADYLILADDNMFKAVPDLTADAMLTTFPVAAFGFLGSNPAAIAVQGSQLTVANRTGLSLVGGNSGFNYTNPDTGATASAPDGVTITEGSLLASSGQINIASVASAGEISVGDFMPTPGMTMGNIAISQGATLDVSGDGGGTVSIRGGQFVMDAASLTADSTGNATGATMAISIDAAGDLTMSNQSSISARSLGAGSSGLVEVSASTIRVTGGSQIITESRTTGNAGNITLTAQGTLAIDGTDSTGTPSSVQTQGPSGTITIFASDIRLDDQAVIMSTTSSAGAAGDIILTTDNLTTTNGGGVVTSGGEFFSSGNIRITATNNVSLQGRFDLSTLSRIANENAGSGGTGNIVVETKDLYLSDGGRILSDTFFSPTPPEGPKVIVAATGSVSVAHGSDIQVRSFISDVGALNLSADSLTMIDRGVISALTFAEGKAGALTITAEDISLSGGSQISSASLVGAGNAGTVEVTANNRLSLTGQGVDDFGNPASSGIFSTTRADFFDPSFTGDAGTITVMAKTLEVNHGAKIDSSSTGFALGNAGNITITGATVSLNGGTISTSSNFSGNAGSIDINAGNQFTMTNSSVTTEATQSGGGAIKITTNPSGTVQLIDSTISASVLDGTGGGGSVNIDPQYVILVNSHILANAVQGAGGNIFITTNLLLLDANSVISASSQFGQNGTITIQSLNAPISGQIHPLGKTPLLATSLLNQQCASVAGGQFSSFTVAGRDSLPTEPGNWIASPLAMLGTGTGEGLSGLSSLSGVSYVVRAGLAPHQIDQTNLINQTNPALLSLRQIAPAGFLTQAFAVDRSAGCTS
jgi:filamentous hemagglutinin family protein